jgi:hypothetical protein
MYAFCENGAIILYTSWTSNMRQLRGYKIFMVWSFDVQYPRPRSFFICGQALFREMEKAIFFLLYLYDDIFVPSRRPFSRVSDDPSRSFFLRGIKERGDQRNESERRVKKQFIKFSRDENYQMLRVQFPCKSLCCLCAMQTR